MKEIFYAAILKQSKRDVLKKRFVFLSHLILLFLSRGQPRLLKCFFISLLGHLFLWFFISVYFIKQIGIHHSTTPYLLAYVGENSRLKNIHEQKKPLTYDKTMTLIAAKKPQPLLERRTSLYTTLKSITPEHTTLKHAAFERTPSEHSAQLSDAKKKSPSIADKTLTYHLLLKILHDEIAAKQTYPESALMLNQSGKVKIRFTLNPDGSITNASILTSSGFPSIDLAALTAVNAAAPIKSASIYLHEKMSFSIEVVFQ